MGLIKYARGYWELRFRSSDRKNSYKRTYRIIDRLYADTGINNT